MGRTRPDVWESPESFEIPKSIRSPKKESPSSVSYTKWEVIGSTLELNDMMKRTVAITARVIDAHRFGLADPGKTVREVMVRIGIRDGATFGKRENSAGHPGSKGRSYRKSNSLIYVYRPQFGEDLIEAGFVFMKR